MRERTIVQSPNGPAAVGPYSPAVACGQMLFTAGQIAIDPTTNTFRSDLDVEGQTELALSNLVALLAAGGATVEDVVKTTVFLTSMDDFAAMNGVYARTFGDARPARSTVAVAALPLGARVEVEAIAMLSDGAGRGA